MAVIEVFLSAAEMKQAREVAEAQRDEALDALEALLKMHRGIDYTTSEQQAALRGARALLAEHGRGGVK